MSINTKTFIDGLKSKYKVAGRAKDIKPIPTEHYLHSGDTTKPHTNKYKDGDLYVDLHDYNNIGKGLDRYAHVYVMTHVNPNDFGHFETWLPDDKVLEMPSTQQYIEWYKEGYLPTPITLIHNEPSGKLMSTNRRRLLAAKAAGIKKLPALVDIGLYTEVFSKELTEVATFKAFESGDELNIAGQIEVKEMPNGRLLVSYPTGLVNTGCQECDDAVVMAEVCRSTDRQAKREVSEVMATDVKGLGLVTLDDGHFLVIYDIEKMSSALVDYDYDLMGEAVMSAIDYRYNSKQGCFEVESIWAKRGYGPITLLSVMQVENDYLTSTREDKVTPEAKVVWQKFYDGIGSNLVKKKPLPYPSPRKEDYLNHMYINKSDPGVKKMVANSNKALRNDRWGELRTAIIEAGDGVLRADMKRIYG